MATLLVFDDDPVSRDVIAGMLRSGGHRVMVGQCGKAAEDDVLQLPFDLLVTDLIMPDCDGWDLIRLLRNHRAALPIIAISGGSPAIDRETALRLADGLGADAVLAKPVRRTK